MWLPVMLALSLMSSYHLSRTSGNISTLFRLFKRTVLKMDMHYDEHDNLPLKMENIVVGLMSLILNLLAAFYRYPLLYF